LRLRLLSRTKLVILVNGQLSRHAQTGRAESVPLKAYQCLFWGASNHALWLVGEEREKGKMEKICKITLLGLFFCSARIAANAQDQPYLSITKDSPTLVQINWTNEVGITYRVWFTTNLATPFSSWPPLEDAFSDDSMVSIYASTTDTPLRFFRIEIPTNSSTPGVQIFSPADAQTVSGEIGVRTGAQLGTQVQGANLYLNDALVGYLNSGGMNFDLDTTHFANGQHTVYVGAVDAANNETLSSSITLDFENPVRWLDACSMFNSFVPIDVDSDIYPADWLVSVSDTNGMIVRTISGSTTDGSIQTSWDGTDDNGQPLPVENIYQITVDVAETSGSSMMMASSLASTLGATSVLSTTSPHGVPEYTMQKPAPNPLTAYLKMLNIYSQLTPQEKLIYPPLPDRPANNPYATTTVGMSAREMFLAIHHSSSIALSVAAGRATPNAGSSMRSGSTKNLVWWEDSWNSGQTVLARVPIPGIFGTVVQNFFLQIRDLIDGATDTVGNNRGVFGSDSIYVLQNSSDLSDLTNNLANPNARALYFYGHGSTNANVIGTTTAGIRARNLGALLGNYYVPALPAAYGVNAGKPAMVTHHPFSFVFLDGCNTGRGDFPEAFGIPKAVSGSALNEAGLHKRAFMGWSGPVTFQLDNTHFDWTQQFWSTWLGSSYNTTLTAAITAANQYRPSVLNNVPIKWYGNGSLTWSN
jgi:hypothetical protein